MQPIAEKPVKSGLRGARFEPQGPRVGIQSRDSPAFVLLMDARRCTIIWRTYGERVPIRYNQQINETDFMASLSQNIIFPRTLGGSSRA